MKVRLLVTICCSLAVSSMLEGCAGNTTRNDEPANVVDSRHAADSRNLDALPQMFFPGAMRSEVKSFAMGAARSKGWTIQQSSQDQLVVSRPIDASLSSGIQGAAAGSRLEVTSYFIEQSGGVNVATRSELVTPAAGGKSPTRTDNTDTFRDSLTQSLASLRDGWSENRGRVARATPPDGGWDDAWSKNPVSPASATETTVFAAKPDATPSVTPPLAPRSVAPVVKPEAPKVVVQATPPTPPAKTAAVAQTTTPTKPATAQTTAPTKATKPATATAQTTTPAKATKPATAIAQTTTPAKATKPATTATAQTTTPAKTTKPATAQTTAPAKAIKVAEPAKTAKPADPKASKTATTAKQDNMMALPTASSPVSGSVSWAAQAEKYARQNGCKIGSKGTQLIESRKDGEIHKVPCIGADSILVKCQKGTCRSLL